MSWLNPSLLWLLGLGAIPVALHFLLRAKPKKLLFPALQLIKLRRKNNVRRMRLRHVWLLLLRIAVIALIVLALARPSLPPGEYGLTWGETGLLAAIAIAAALVYRFMLRHWTKQSLPQHALTYRRSMLRGGTGLAALLLILLLVGWPYQRRIAAGMKETPKSVAENLPVTALFLFDVSPSMEYRLESRDRLDVARDIAQRHLEALPAGSRIGVADTSSDHPMLFQADRNAAAERLEDLQISPVVIPLDQRLRTALRLQEEDQRRTLDSQESVAVEMRQDRFLREIYIFTDLAGSAWRRGGSQVLRADLERLPWVSVYLIDVGVEQAVDVAVTDLQLSKETISRGGELIVHATIAVTGPPPADATAEIFVDDGTGDLVKQGQAKIDAVPGTAARLTFSLRGLERAVTRGEVRVDSSDPLAIDDVRWFTVRVRPPVPVLIIADRRSDAIYWMEALAPAELVRLGTARYECEWIPPSRADEIEFSRYESICLIDVAHPDGALWRKLESYVAAGGGLAVMLGMDGRTDPRVAIDYSTDDAMKVLPGTLLADLSFVDFARLDLPDLTHPMLRKFDEFGGAGELTQVGISRFWRIEPHAEANVFGWFDDPRRSPALVERPHGRGRTVMLTTAVDRSGWADLPTANWAYVAFADQAMQYLARRSLSRYNETAGAEVHLPIEPSPGTRRYLLRKPGLQQLAGEIPRDENRIVIRDTNEIGHYGIVPANDEPAKFDYGFSINIEPRECDLTRLSTDDLDALLGEKRYRVARSIDELVREVVDVRLGQEIYPLMIGLMLFIFVAEHFVANRFYAAEQSAEHR